MKMEKVTSADDPRLDLFRGARERDLRSEGIMIVEGRLCVERCLSAGFDVMAVLCEAGRHGRLAEPPRTIPALSAGREVMERIAGYGFHRGIIAAARRPRAVSLNDLLASVPGEGYLGVVCLDRCASGENLGGIVRTAHAFGFQAVISSGSADPFSRRVIRVSAGSVFSIPVIETGEMGAALRALRSGRCRVYGAVTDRASAPLETCAVPPRRAVLLGSEASGLGDDLLRLCDETIHIPMIDAIDSLNISVAAGIIMQKFSLAARR